MRNESEKCLIYISTSLQIARLPETKIDADVQLYKEYLQPTCIKKIKVTLTPQCYPGHAPFLNQFLRF